MESLFGLDIQPDGETGRIDKSGNMTMAVGNYMLEQFKVGTKAIYFTNNVPYQPRNAIMAADFSGFGKRHDAHPSVCSQAYHQVLPVDCTLWRYWPVARHC